jgi:hypothetical protein
MKIYLILVVGLACVLIAMTARADVPTPPVPL